MNGRRRLRPKASDPGDKARRVAGEKRDKANKGVRRAANGWQPVAYGADQAARVVHLRDSAC